MFSDKFINMNNVCATLELLIYFTQSRLLAAFDYTSKPWRFFKA